MKYTQKKVIANAYARKLNIANPGHEVDNAKAGTFLAEAASAIGETLGFGYYEEVTDVAALGRIENLINDATAARLTKFAVVGKAKALA